MNKPVLVIMAAGMGSRYGGLKQIDPIDDRGQMIIDYSVYDAKQAGFEKVVFIIKHEIEKEFKEVLGNRLSEFIEVEYVYQDVQSIPEGFVVPEERIKPWGTGHAVWSCKEVVDGPFAVINADDYYGRDAFVKIYNYLANTTDDEKYRYTMVGYELHNTVTENGHVSRGVCIVDENQHLVDITERTQIEIREQGIAYTEDAGSTWVDMTDDTVVSMNMWGFSASMLKELEIRMVDFFERNLTSNPLKSEYFLPSVVSQLLEEERATATVLKSTDKWYGVTYKEDKEVIVNAMNEMVKNGLYPEYLWKA